MDKTQIKLSFPKQEEMNGAILDLLRKIPSHYYFILSLLLYSSSSAGRSTKKILIVVLAFWYRRIGKRALLNSNGLNLNAIVTGGSGGVGKATVCMLLDLGWSVIACDRDENGLKILLDEMKGKYNDKLKIYALDITSHEQRDKFFGYVRDEFNQSLDLLVNNAGIHSIGPVLECTNQNIDLVAAVNAHAPVNLTRGLLPLLMKSKKGKGSVVNISSTTAIQAWPWAGSYTATKYYLEGATNTMRIECIAADIPVSFTLIEPGAILTPMISHIPKDQEKWADNNLTSPFSNICRNSALGQKKAESYGLTGLVCVSTDDVARAICEAASSNSPPERVLVATVIFELLVSVSSWLPPFLGDRLVSAF